MAAATIAAAAAARSPSLLLLPLPPSPRNTFFFTSSCCCCSSRAVQPCAVDKQQNGVALLRQMPGCLLLCWTDMELMGFKNLLPCSPMVRHNKRKMAYTSRGSSSRAIYTERQESLVKDTWAILKKDAQRNATKLFMKVFEIAPSAKKLFSFLKDSTVPLEENPKLKSHALKVFVIICEAATTLRKKGQVSTPGSTMKDMATAHNLSGVVDEHYEVVRFCLLKTIEEGLPSGMWNDEVKDAWQQAYDELVVAMRAEA